MKICWKWLNQGGGYINVYFNFTSLYFEKLFHNKRIKKKGRNYSAFDILSLGASRAPTPGDNVHGATENGGNVRQTLAKQCIKYVSNMYQICIISIELEVEVIICERRVYKTTF